MSSTIEIDGSKTPSTEKTDAVGVLHHEEPPATIVAKGSAVNGFLIFACTTFAAASFLFGYDDKVISPIIALEPFVSLALSDFYTTGTSRAWLTTTATTG